MIVDKNKTFFICFYQINTAYANPANILPINPGIVVDLNECTILNCWLEISPKHCNQFPPQSSFEHKMPCLLCFTASIILL